MRTIAHISDLHFGTVMPPIADALAADIRELAPSLVVASGDFTQRARGGQFREAAAFLARLPRPQLVVPGNHDIPLYDVVRRFFFPLDRYLKYISKDLRPVFRDDGLLVVGINTARSFTWDWSDFWKGGRISEEQLIDVKTKACEVPAEVFKVVVTHHPFIPSPGEPLTDMVGRAGEALAAFEGCGVDMVLSGHLHLGYTGDMRTHYHAVVKRSILSVHAGTATSSRRRKDQPNSYNFITINPDHVAVEVRSYDGVKFVKTVKTHFAKVDGIWVKEG